MGLRYVVFRLGFELKKKIGVFRKKFPQNPAPKNFVKFELWKKTFRFWGVVQGEKPNHKPIPAPDFTPYEAGDIPFFSAGFKELGKDYDWVTNPDTGYRYDSSKHWVEIEDYNPENGDIKYVWEKSRFSYLYDVIRNDFHTGNDRSEWVFGEIRSWLGANPVNSGPNYKCSQEISLRVLNWTYALNYYRESKYLDEKLFSQIMNAIYWQMKHVYANIHFSRIAVRNNHAITETLTLYLAGLFFPFFPEAEKWKRKGKKWFEQEIDYQIYPDGTFLQFSMNYHRVVVQLLTWAIKSADFFGEKYKPVVYERAYLSVRFLYACQEKTTGWLPNYGSNDGALFFKLNSANYRDYRPQLNVLHHLLTGSKLYDSPSSWEEDELWFRTKGTKALGFEKILSTEGWNIFENGGYYVLNEPETLTFIRCGKHKDRPAQADNLHLDIWHKGENIVFDGGSYKYNTDPKTLKYFMGTESHNTVMLDDFDQMLKGARFIWYNWTQAKKAQVSEIDGEYVFEGEISAFTYIHPKIVHRRTLKKKKGEASWQIEDEIENLPSGIKMKQYWHVAPSVKINASDKLGKPLRLNREKALRSDYYGQKDEAIQYVAQSTNNIINTKINL